MKRLACGALFACLLLSAGCRSPSLGPKFANIRVGLSRDEVLAFLGPPDSKGDVGITSVVEQWEYSDSDNVYLIRFGPRGNEPRSQWRVVSMSTSRRKSIVGSFARVANGQSRDDVLGILGEPGAARLMTAPTTDLSYSGPHEPLRALLNGRQFEEWEYADGDTVYLVWFGTLQNEPQDDWKVIGKKSYRPETPPAMLP
ncbi:MAG TPA: hypothetical protein VFA26_26170 [Gemmataceae bacterium]|nr:hypothetical protein [Gemmataceae bacterium]